MKKIMLPGPSDISVVIPLFNKEKTIERALLSVINQNHTPKKIIVVDDGSTDESAVIVQQMARTYPAVIYIRQSNQGVSGARNRGAKNVETNYFCLLDADDEWEPGYMDHLLSLMKIAEDADIYSLAYQMQSDIGFLKPNVDLPDDFIGYVKNALETYRNGYGYIHSSAVCFKTSFFWELGGFPDGSIYGEDIYLWMKAFLHGKAAFINKISATIYKEQINSVNWRKLHPYHVSYFVDHLHEYEPDEQKDIRDFLIKNINIQWAASKLEQNRWQQKLLKEYAYKLSVSSGLLLECAGLIPNQIFWFIKKRRSHNRLIKKRS